MDKLNHYRAIIREFFTVYERFLNAPPASDLNVVTALDDQHNQYVLFKAGWKGNDYCRYFSLHVSLRNGKIWIEEDMTEDGIATYFLEQGVPREDIVLVFHPPFMRPLTEFAVA